MSARSSRQSADQEVAEMTEYHGTCRLRAFRSGTNGTRLTPSQQRLWEALEARFGNGIGTVASANIPIRPVTLIDRHSGVVRIGRYT